MLMHHLYDPEFGNVAKYFPREHSLIPLHAHVALLGGFLSILTGLIYQAFPRAGRSVLAEIHFWAVNIALVAIFAKIVLTMFQTQQFGGFLEPVQGGINSFGGLGYVSSIILFVVNVFRNVRNEDGAFMPNKEQS